MSRSQSIVFFDGVCNLCNTSIDFIIKRDHRNNFLVGALQDDFSKEILSGFKVRQDYLDSLVLLEDGEVFYKSTAALKIAKNLSGLWPIFYLLLILPTWIRDPIYDFLGKNRYRWFGKKNTCRIATPEEKAKFLSGETYPLAKS